MSFSIKKQTTSCLFSHSLPKMDNTVKLITHTIFLFLFIISSCSSVYSLAYQTPNPFTPKASLIRYWNKHISNNLTKPTFLISKSSPLSAAESAFFTKLADEQTLSSHLAAFCSTADLFCFLNSDSTPVTENHKSDANFAFYDNKKFSNYGNNRLDGVDQFKNYSNGVNFATGSFTRYSRSSTSHHEDFTSYADDGNVGNANFSSYGASATGGSGDFKNYMPRVNVPDLRFTSYDSDGNGHKLTFSSYADDTNSGKEGFTSYGKNGNAVPLEFTRYGDTSNVVASTFTGYSELGNGGNDSFKGYSTNANNPANIFRNYGGGGNGGTESFTSYRDTANAGRDNFQSYGKSSNSGKTNFVNYGKSFNVGLDSFKEYAKGAVDQLFGFKVYGVNNTFIEYANKKDVTFAGYTKPVLDKNDDTGDSISVGVKTVNKVVEEGKFFRESMLKEGNVMKMPNIRDWMPKRSFLPRGISSKLPSTTEGLPELKRAFRVEENSTMERVMVNALAECERAPSQGETKRCVGSVEEMIDFAASVLGSNVVVRTTENVMGSKESVVLGSVKGINGGRVTKSVSCHQSLFPYLLYYCHSVPKVRVYEADILSVESKAKINHGVAICHLDTSYWSATHGAFEALGYGPGLIEVCHWIFENDMTWSTAD